MASTPRRWFLGVIAAASAVAAGGGLFLRARSPSSPARPARTAREALLDAMLPAGAGMPDALSSGVATYLELALSDPKFSAARKLIEQGVEQLENRARSQHAKPLHELDAPARLSLLAGAMNADREFPWTSFRDALLDFVLEGYLGHPARGGNVDGRVWTSIGLPLANGASPSPSDRFDVNRARADASVVASAARERWDAIVVGSGAGGAVAAWRLATAGLRVLVLEKGPRLPPRAIVPDEIGSCLRDAFVPHVGDNPHVLVEDGRPHKSYQGWTSSCVGGGTVHMAAMLYRLHPEDFDGASRFGVPRGSTLIDWPFGYDELRPFYDRIQDFLGLSGATGRNPFEPDAAPYPEPPLPTHPAAEAINRAAQELDLHPFPTPRGIVTRARQGRSACVQCGYCGAYACPVGAKASTADSFLPAAESTGRCRVLPGASVIEVATDDAGRASHVVVADRAGGNHKLTAPSIVLAASAVETARLLLLSRSSREPAGLGNQSGQVGQNLVLSLEASGRAVFPFPSPLFGREHERFPFINRSIQDRYLDREAPHGYPKGGTLVLDRAHLNPIQRGRRAAHDDDATLGPPLVARLSRALARERAIAYETFVEMLPRAGAHVRLDPGVKDANGLPVARITVDDFPGESERAGRVASLGRELLARMNPAALVDEASLRRTYFLQGGTCRMGRNPATSVCNPRGRVHGIEGLVVCDGSALPTMGGVPPTLTIMANALRIAELVVNEALAR